MPTANLDSLATAIDHYGDPDDAIDRALEAPPEINSGEPEGALRYIRAKELADNDHWIDMGTFRQVHSVKVFPYAVQFRSEGVLYTKGTNYSMWIVRPD